MDCRLAMDRCLRIGSYQRLTRRLRSIATNNEAVAERHPTRKRICVPEQLTTRERLSVTRFARELAPRGKSGSIRAPTSSLVAPQCKRGGAETPRRR